MNRPRVMLRARARPMRSPSDKSIAATLLVPQRRHPESVFYIAVEMAIADHPPGRRRQSPTSGSHRTKHADLPHYALGRRFTALQEPATPHMGGAALLSVTVSLL
jgi:hypothetical protein